MDQRNDVLLSDRGGEEAYAVKLSLYEGEKLQMVYSDHLTETMVAWFVANCDYARVEYKDATPFWVRADSLKCNTKPTQNVDNECDDVRVRRAPPPKSTPPGFYDGWNAVKSYRPK